MRSDQTCHVLLIDDDLGVRSLAADYLREEGFRVTEAETGDEAIDILNTENVFDVVFTDVRMPGKVDGIGVAEHVRHAFPNLPLLIVSGYAAQLTSQLASIGPPTAFLQKPYRLTDIGEILTRLALPT